MLALIHLFEVPMGKKYIVSSLYHSQIKIAFVFLETEPKTVVEVK